MKVQTKLITVINCFFYVDCWCIKSFYTHMEHEIVGLGIRIGERTTRYQEDNNQKKIINVLTVDLFNTF